LRHFGSSCNPQFEQWIVSTATSADPEAIQPASLALASMAAFTIAAL
jgi:hypothetical protein